MKRRMSIGSPAWISTIVDGAGMLGMRLSAKQAEEFAVHARELVHWNRKVNLTAITDPFDMAVKHYLDSIIAVPLIDDHMTADSGASLLDVGSGAGFPGIPLKIVRPSLSVTLLEARRKRVNYLKQAIRSLQIGGIHVRRQRFEDVPQEERFDLIVCRAFADLEPFVRSALPMLNGNGMVVAYKGRHDGRLAAEIEGLRAMEGQGGSGSTKGGGSRIRVAVRQCRLPYIQTERTLVTVRTLKSLN
ncbi:MAG: 16S rRNA (guanine(527)-N(7))-methyltransferase RsmG [Deltaproteobacteria bacterium]|nr:16S rRNA (guanine(527)-N(7))-methyltransferase RsmG [Deltaproteobacteria bacterium]